MESVWSGGGRLERLRGDGARLALALGAVVALQILVILAGDSRFGSGSDAGGRAASIAAAVDNGGCDHDLGYWAADADPSGVHHPLTRSDASSGRYLQPTDVVYVCAAATSALFGPAMALAVSVLGVVMAAAGAWLLDRASGGAGWLALALTGGVGSIAFYGADTWEHAPAAGAAILGTALLIRTSGYTSGVIGGALWGLAVAFRLETGLVALALALVLALTAPLRRALLRSWPRQALFAASALVVVAGDRILERAVLSSGIRDSRVVGSAGGGGGQIAGAASNVGQRARDVLVTNLGTRPDDTDVLAFAVGAVFCAALGLLAVDLVRGSLGHRIRYGGAAVIALVLLLSTVDRGFVPGMFVAAPLAVVGVVVAVRSGPSGPVPPALARAALVALPVIWAFQWVGNLTAQWGGRYQLVSAGLLTVAGIAGLRDRWHTFGGRVILAAAVWIGLLGLAWHVERTMLIAEPFDDLAEVPCDGVLVSAEEFFLREGGGLDAVQQQQLGDCALLTSTPASAVDALGVAAEMGVRRGTVVYRGTGSVAASSLRPWTIESVTADRLGRLPVTVVEVRLASNTRSP